MKMLNSKYTSILTAFCEKAYITPWKKLDAMTTLTTSQALQKRLLFGKWCEVCNLIHSDVKNSSLAIINAAQKGIKADLIVLLFNSKKHYFSILKKYKKGGNKLEKKE